MLGTMNSAAYASISSLESAIRRVRKLPRKDIESLARYSVSEYALGDKVWLMCLSDDHRAKYYDSLAARGIVKYGFRNVKKLLRYRYNY